jgi:hypothetical protein
MNKVEVIIEPVRVMYVQAEGGLSGIRQAWIKLESTLSSLRRRRFYGTYSYVERVYRACVAIDDEKEAETLNLPTWTIPGGKYLRQKIADWAVRPEIMGETFESMAKENDSDLTRPTIEFYRSQKEVILLLPIV